MSLRVWLPLDGDLRNLGASDIEVTNNGATVDNTGKIGKCYYFSGSAQYLQLNKTLGDIYSGDFSWCIWLKPTDDSRGIIFSEYATSGSSGVAFELLANRVIRVYWNGSPDWSFGISINKDEWSHVAITKKNNTIKVYVNGQYKTEKTGALSARPSTACIRLGDDYRGGTSVSYMGYMNDARIYDHCLSAAEVKDIAQGLVLHYKLDDIYAEMTTNLYSGTFSNTCYNGATNKYSYGTSTDIYKTTGYFQGKDSVKIYMGTSGLDAYPYVYFDAFNTTGTAIHTLSFDYYPTTQTSIIPYSYAGAYNISYTTSNGNSNSYTNVGQVTIPVLTNQWNHISITMQKYDTTNTIRGNGYIRIGSSKHTSTSTDYWLFANIQVEAKDHETGYTFPGTTRSNIQIQDSSGYNHNGICVDTTISSDSPRYNTCISCSGTTVDSSSNTITGAQFFYCNMEMPAMNAITVTWWGKNIAYSRGGIFETSNSIQTNTTKGTDYNTTAFANWDNTFGIYNGSTRVNIFSNFIKDGSWHYHTITFDGTNVKYYCDSVLKQTSALSGTLPAWKSFCIGLGKAGGVWRQIQQNISDFRIYCTPLLDNDIKSLYNIGMRVDNSHNVHTEELIETSSNIWTIENLLKYRKSGNSAQEIFYKNGKSYIKTWPAEYHKNITIDGETTSCVLYTEFQPNTQYVFDMWIDSSESTALGAFSVVYTDGTSSTALQMPANGNDEWVHKQYISDSGKSVLKMLQRYGSNTPICTSLDSYIGPLDTFQIKKTAQIKATTFSEDSSTAKIFKSGYLKSSQLIER